MTVPTIYRLARLDETGKIPKSDLPAGAIPNIYEAVNQTAMLTLSASQGDYARRADDDGVYILAGTDPTLLANWKLVGYTVAGGPGGSGTVQSVNTIEPDEFGDITLTAANVGAATPTEVSTAVSDHVAAANPHTAYLLKSSVGTPNNPPALDGSGVLAVSVLPADVKTVFWAAASQAAMLALSSAKQGHFAIRSDLAAELQYWLLVGTNPSVLANWKNVYMGSPVTSVNGQSPVNGAVTLSAANVGAVPTTRTVSTSGGITGGGALSGNLSLALTYGTAANTVCQGNDARLGGLFIQPGVLNYNDPLPVGSEGKIYARRLTA